MVHEFKPKVWMTCPLCNKQSPMPDPDRKEWVGLTDEEVLGVFGKFTAMTGKSWLDLYRMTEAKLKEKNCE